MTLESAKLIAASIVGARLDYCNSLLYGSTAQNIDRLQRVLNTLARIVLQTSRVQRTQQNFDVSYTGCQSGSA